MSVLERLKLAKEKYVRAERNAQRLGVLTRKFAINMSTLKNRRINVTKRETAGE